MKKIYDRDKLAKIIRKFKKKKKKIVFTNGCFDILHVGHIRLFKKAKSLGDILIVAVNSDRSIKKIKGPERPIIPLKYRMEVLSSISWIDYIVPFNEQTPLESILVLKPDIIVKGSDWKYKNVVGREYAKVYRYPLVKGWSTTDIIEKIKNL